MRFLVRFKDEQPRQRWIEADRYHPAIDSQGFIVFSMRTLDVIDLFAPGRIRDVTWLVPMGEDDEQ